MSLSDKYVWASLGMVYLSFFCDGLYFPIFWCHLCIFLVWKSE